MILASARKLFAARGFAATSLREIARDAGVDPAMVHHYFSGKEELFNACVELPVDPEQVLGDVSTAPPQERGEALLRTLLVLWDSPAQPALLALLRSATSSRMQSTLIRQVLLGRVLAKVMADLPGDAPERELRGSLVASQVMGLIMARYLLRIDPLATATHDELVKLIAPTLQNYLTGPLAPGMGSSPHGLRPQRAPTVGDQQEPQSWESE
ncbi:MAG: TetR family transcriptional regulator [Specibacter sp.]